MVSSDNFGLGKIAAAGLSPRIPDGAKVGVLGFAADFFATNEREIAFTKWLQVNRPDITPRIHRFARIEDSAAAADDLLSANPDLAGLFVVWDTPALAAANRLAERAATMPMATVDLGEAAAIALAKGDSFCCIAAQQPFQQGIAAAQTVVVLARFAVSLAFATLWESIGPRHALYLAAGFLVAGIAAAGWLLKGIDR